MLLIGLNHPDAGTAEESWSHHASLSEVSKPDGQEDKSNQVVAMWSLTLIDSTSCSSHFGVLDIC